MQDKDKKSKLEKQRLKSEANKRRAEKAKERRKQYLNGLRNCRPCRRVILLDICRAIRHHFPKLLERLSTGFDPRKRKSYGREELLLGAIMLFIFKQSSRNEMNNNRSEEKFAKNYISAFGVRLPHMDTVDTLLQQLPAEELEEVKAYMMKTLLKSRVFHKFRLFRKYFSISIDATGLGSYKEEPYEGCVFRRYKTKDKDKEEQELDQAGKPEKIGEVEKTKKTEKKVWFQPVLEAKLVCPNGFSISVGTEWILNEGEWKKQDCELAAFKRLAEQLKKDFPRLSICILADALYPNQQVFQICKQYGWACILTLKDGQLKDIWQEVELFNLFYKKNQHRQEFVLNKTQVVGYKYRWINGVNYQGHELSWVECIKTLRNIQTGEETINRFVHVTNFEILSTNVVATSQYGRLRWKIENEGFNTQKNGGYNLEHKFSRKSLVATKNYFQALQIAHFINQLVELCHTTQALLKSKCTLKHLWKLLLAFMFFGDISEEQFMQQFEPTRFRYP